MRPKVRKQMESFAAQRARRKVWQRIVCAMMCIVVFCTTYALILPAITMSSDALCGLSEHTHTEECYAQSSTADTIELVCQPEIHSHSDSCYDAEGNLICGKADYILHTHNEYCFDTEDNLICTLSETTGLTDVTEHSHDESCYTDGVLTCGKLELYAHDHTESCIQVTEAEKEPICQKTVHTHTLICYSDSSADLETEEDWEKTVNKAELIDDASADLLTIARTQLGYTESKANYTVLDDGVTIRGYTRYGAWGGDPYAEWSELFVAFCLHYAEVKDTDFPRADGEKTWIQALKEAGLFASAGYTPASGDLIFLEEQDTEDPERYVGIVTSVNENGYIDAILGDYKDEVRSETFTPSDERIQGYGMMPGDGSVEAGSETTPETIPETTAETTSEPADTEADTPLTAEIEIDLTGGAAAAQAGEAAEEEAEEEIEEVVEETPVRMTWRLRSASNAVAIDDDSDDSSSSKSQNLADYMNGEGDGIAIQYKYSSDSTWTDLNGVLDNLIVGEDFLIQFTINYTLPGGTLSSDRTTMYYQLPINKLIEARSGNVRDNSGTIVGTYTIDTNGLVTITFLDYYVQQNASGKEIKGSLSFTSDIYDFDTDGDYKVKLSESETSYIEVTLRRTIENDLKVEKTAGEADLENATVSYTIKVSSVSGTSKEVVLTDTLTNGAVSGTVTIVDKNGNTVSGVTTPEDGSKNFTLTLPQMNAGDEYTITYTAELTQVSNGQVNMTNAVTVKSNLGDDKNLTDSDEITVPFNYSFGGDNFTKSETVNEDGTLTWTVTINADAFPVSMKGWTLSDTFNGVALDSDVTITFADGTTTYTGKLPYTFTSDHKGLITVTYTTSADYGLGMNGAVNKATLAPPDDPDLPDYPTYEEEDNYLNPGDYWVNYNPLKKEFNSVTTGEDGTYGVLEWKLSVVNEDSTLASGWYVKDTLTGEQYYTSAQETAIRNAIETELKGLYSNLPTYTLEFDGSYMVGDTSYHNSFTLTVNQPLAKGSTFSITYHSTTAAYQDTTQYYTNAATLNDKVSISDTYTHYPLLRKVDGNNNSNSATSYDLNYLTTGLVNWRIYISPTAEMAYKDLIVTEDIPDDPTLNLLQFNGYTFNFAEGSTTASVSVTINGTAYTVKAEQKTVDGNKIIEITIPKEVVAYYVGERMTINVEMDVSDLVDSLDAADSNSTNEYAKKYSHKILNNSVTIRVDGKDSDAGKDSQEQIIYKPSSSGDSSTKDEELIKKTTAGIEDGYVIPYVITLNAEAEDLDSESEWLEVEDTLKFTNWNVTNSRYSTALDTSDVFITLYDAAGNVVKEKTALTALAEDESPVYPGGFIYTQSSEWMYGTQEYVTSTIKFYIPDGYKVVLEYHYAFYGEENSNVTLGVSNTSVLKATGLKVDSATSGWYTITESEAQANLRSINIYKVDAYNSAIHLAGAEYDLYKYNSETKKYEYVQSVSSNGKSELEIDTIVVNTAYFLIETKAPTGYILDESLHYFMIRDESVRDSNGNVVYHKPDDFPSNAYYSSGGIMYITNEQYTDKITANKQWYDADGNLLSADKIPKGTKIEVKLYQVYSNYPVNFDYGTIGTDATLTLKVGEYSYTEEVFSETTAAGQLQIGDTITVTYKLKEAITMNYPGMVHVTETEYNQIPFTVSDDGLTYTYRYRITDASTTLRGWVGEGNKDKVESVTWYVDTPFEQADHARSTKEYQIVTLSADNNWAHTFYDLPAYKLGDNGQIQGYYSYYVNEISSSLAGYTPSYSTGFSSSTSIQNGTIIIKNAPPDTTSLGIEKVWSDGTAPVDVITVDLYRIAETTGQDQRYVDINFYIGTWSGGSDYLNQHYQVEVGSTVRLTMKLKGGNPSIASDASSIPLTETVGDTDSGYTTYMYTFVATSDVNIRGHVGTYTREDALVEVVDKPERTVYEDAVYIENIQILASGGSSTTTADGVTITNNGNWKVTIEGLPTVGMTENGNPLYYSYYIVEDALDQTNNSFTINGVTYFVTYKAGDDSIVQHESPTVTGGSLQVINTPVDDAWIEFEVDKAWVTPSGETAEGPIDSIEFKIWQVDSNGAKSLYKTVTLTKEEGWTSGTLYVPSSTKYTYIVEETTTGYEVAYTYTDSGGATCKHIVDGGTVTITNTVITYILPETGGEGTIMYTLGGLALCAVAILMYIQKKGRKGAASP